MAFTSNNDINFLQGSDTAIVSAGAGNDTYVLDSTLLNDNQVITISDTQGANKIQLVGGLTITSSKVAADTLQLTLSNGAVVNVLGASSFSYVTGGAIPSGTGGVTNTYAQLASSLGVATLPTGTTVTDGAANATVSTDGSVTTDGGTGGGTGTTLPLTNNTDTLTANVFNAGLVYTPGGDDRINSLQDEDILTGTGTNPTLNATLGNANDNGATVITPKLIGIETVNVAFTGSGGAAVTDLDLQDATGLQEVNITRVSQSSNTARVENIKQVLDTLSIASSNANNQGTVEFSYSNGVLAGLNTTALTLDNVQVGQVNIGQNTSGVGASGVGVQSYEELTIDSTGTANNVGILNLPMDTGSAGKITITGDQNLTLANSISVNNGAVTESVRFGGGINGASGRLASIDASALTGNLTLNIGNGLLSTGKADTSGVVQNVTITAGSGNDKFILRDVVQVGDSLAGGTGTDTLVIASDGTAANSGVVSTLSSVITGFENLEVRASAGGVQTVDASKVVDATNVLVRNEGAANGGAAFPAAVADASAARALVTNLNGLSATLANAVTVQHSNTGSNNILNNTINLNLATATGTTDSVTLNIAEGVNTDPRFNLILGTQNAAGVTGGVESVTLSDNDTESNTVALSSVAQHTGTVTLKGGVVGTFLNLDTTTAGANGGVYQYDVTGATDLNSSNAGATVGRIADQSGVATQVRLTAGTIDASAEVANVIARVSSSPASVSAVGAQKITLGSGNDTVIFDNLADTRAGLTISDTVAGGAGTDTLAIDGNVAVTLGASEWTNVSGFESIRLIGNGVATGTTAYNLTLTNSLLAANKDANGYLNIVNDNDLFNDTARTVAQAAAPTVTNADGTTPVVANDAGLFSGDVTLDARTLSAGSKWSYNGNEGAGRSADRLILADANIDGNAVIDGGAIDNLTNNRGIASTNGTSVVGNAINANKGNADVIEVRNAAVVSQGDLANVKNIGTLSFTNDLAVTQVSTLQLNDTIVDGLVDSYQASTSRAAAATTTTGGANVEVLQINAVDNVNVVAATTGLVIEAGSLTDKSDLDITLGRGANNITTGAGQDRAVLLGNYVAGTYAVTENGVNINAQSTATAVARVVTDTINLGTGIDTLVTYGAINLVGATLTGVENITANSALVITTSQWAALVAARAAAGVTTPIITFSGAQAHQLVIVDNTAGADAIDLSLVQVSGGSLTYDVGNQVGTGGAGVVTTSNTPAITGTGTIALPGVIGTTPTNNATPIAVTSVTAGTTYALTAAGENLQEVGTGSTTVTINGLTATGTYNAFETGDTLKLLTSSNVAGVNGGVALGFSTLDLTNAATTIVATMTATQYNALSTITTAGGDDSVSLTTAGTITANSNLFGMGIVEGSTVTLGTAAGDLALILNEGTGAAATSTFILGNGVYTGAWAGIETTDVVRVGTTTDVSGNSGLNAGVVIDFQNTATAGAGLTLNGNQNGLVTFANATGAQTVTLSAADAFTTNAAIETYALGNFAGNVVTLGVAGQTITDSGAQNDEVNTGALTSLTGTTLTLTAGGTDVLTVFTTATNLTGINAGGVTTAETLNISGIADVTTNVAQFNAFTTITATGTNNVSIADAGTLTLGAVATAVETVTLTSASNDTVNVTTGAAGSFLGTVNIAAGGTDRVNITNAAIDDTGTNRVTLTGFTAGSGGDVLGLTIGATAQNAGFQTLNAANTAVTAAANSVLELQAGAAGELIDLTNIASVKTLLVAGIGTIANGSYTAVVYGGGNAGLYNFTFTDAGADGLAAAAGEFAVELVGVVNSVTTDALVAGNFV